MSTISIESMVNTLHAIYSWQHVNMGHADRVAAMSVRIGEKLNGGTRLNEEKLKLLEYAGRLHDLGWIAINPMIITKPGSLTVAEMAAMQSHCRTGFEFLAYSNLPTEIRYTVLYHHENWNGSGYPTNISGLDIPLFPRIVHVADVWDALTHDRPYRSAMKPNVAVSVMDDMTGFFDPKIFAAFLEVIGDQFR